MIELLANLISYHILLKINKIVGFPSSVDMRAHSVHHCVTRICVTTKIMICEGKKLKFIYYIF